MNKELIRMLADLISRLLILLFKFNLTVFFKANIKYLKETNSSASLKIFIPILSSFLHITHNDLLGSSRCFADNAMGFM